MGGKEGKEKEKRVKRLCPSSAAVGSWFKSLQLPELQVTRSQVTLLSRWKDVVRLPSLSRWEDDNVNGRDDLLPHRTVLRKKWDNIQD